MTVYRADGTGLTEASWPYRPGTWVCQVGPKIPNLTFTRDRDHLVINAAGDGVRLDRDTMRAIGAMMMQLASEIEVEVASRTVPS
jgi:hypothetical protein